MAIRDESTSTVQILRDARFHMAAVTADPNTLHLAEPVVGLRKTLKTKRNTAEDAEEVRIEKLAVLLRADYDLDWKLRRVELDLLGQVKKNREAELYRALLPKGLTALIALRGEEEAREVRALIVRMAERAPDLHKTYAKELEELCVAEEKADKEWLAAETTAARAFADEVVARAGTVRQLQKNEGALTMLYPGDRNHVRSYFRPLPRRGAAHDGNPAGGGGTPA